VGLILVGLVAVAAALAGLLGRPMWATSVGAALVVVYWALELLAAGSARQASSSAAVAVALGGMVLRFAVVLGVLIAVAVWCRPALVDAAFGFLGAYTVYVFVRLIANPTLSAHSQ
jgi:hypothetical protein